MGTHISTISQDSAAGSRNDGAYTNSYFLKVPGDEEKKSTQKCIFFQIVVIYSKEKKNQLAKVWIISDAYLMEEPFLC